MDIMEFRIKYGSLKVDLFKRVSEIARYFVWSENCRVSSFKLKNDLKIKLMIMIIKNR